MGKYDQACLSDSWYSFFSQNFPSNLIETLIGRNVANHPIYEDLAQLQGYMIAWPPQEQGIQFRVNILVIILKISLGGGCAHSSFL